MNAYFVSDRERASAKRAGVSVVMMGALFLGATIAMAALIEKGPWDGLHDLTGPLFGMAVGLLMIGLGIGALFGSRACLGAGMAITLLSILWSLFVRIAWGLGTAYISLLLLPIALFVQMVRGWSPLKLVHAEKREAGDRPVQAEPSTYQRLCRLEDMLAKGLISQEEYRAKHKEIAGW